jgi:hypothetical protein
MAGWLRQVTQPPFIAGPLWASLFTSWQFLYSRQFCRFVILACWKPDIKILSRLSGLARAQKF